MIFDAYPVSLTIGDVPAVTTVFLASAKDLPTSARKWAIKYKTV